VKRRDPVQVLVDAEGPGRPELEPRILPSRHASIMIYARPLAQPRTRSNGSRRQEGSTVPRAHVDRLG
jgi:hypothetical protein